MQGIAGNGVCIITSTKVFVPHRTKEAVHASMMQSPSGCTNPCQPGAVRGSGPRQRIVADSLERQAIIAACLVSVEPQASLFARCQQRTLGPQRGQCESNLHLRPRCAGRGSPLRCDVVVKFNSPCLTSSSFAIIRRRASSS